MNAPWTARVLTLYPEMFPGPLGHALAGKGLAEDKWALSVHNIRDWATDTHRTVDDTPFGGGPGMVMRADIPDRALQNVHTGTHPPILLSPRGRRLSQDKVRELAGREGITLVCGRFEGVDQRLIDVWDMEEISLGDFVLSGGEMAALSLMDAVVRLLPGIFGRAASTEGESF